MAYICKKGTGRLHVRYRDAPVPNGLATTVARLAPCRSICV